MSMLIHKKDKMIRSLKDENGELKKLIEALNKKLMGSDVVGEEDRKAIIDLTEQYEANTKMAIELGCLITRKAFRIESGGSQKTR